MKNLMPLACQDTTLPPDQLTVAGAAPEPGGAAEVILGEVLDDGPRRSRSLEQVEDQPDRVPDLLVGIEDDPALRIVDQPRGGAEPESAVAGLLELAAQQAGTEPVQFGLAHGAEDPQEQTVGVLRGIIDPVVVDDQGISQGTDFDEGIPIAAGPRQAGRFEAED